VSGQELRKYRDGERALRDLGYCRTGVESRDALEIRHMIERTRQYLTEQGIDPDAALVERRTAERDAAKARARHVKDLAIAVKRAKRAAFVAQTSWRLSRSSADLDAITKAEEHAQQLEAALREACCNDEVLIAQVKRQVSR
jgi:hypothetical protein